MIRWEAFSELLARYSRVDKVREDDVLFGSGLDISSIAFTEFVMELEDLTGNNINMDDLDSSVVTARQLFERLGGRLSA